MYLKHFVPISNRGETGQAWGQDPQVWGGAVLGNPARPAVMSSGYRDISVF